jgi:ankyrin repeat protein
MNNVDEILGALYRKDYQALDQLVPANINVLDPDGRTPLMHAILAEDADPAMVRYFLNHGADVNVHDISEQWTALHLAARDQNEAVVRLLLEAGANVDALDSFNNTPLVRAVFHSSPNPAVIRLLLQYGADPYKENNTGSSAVDIARIMGQNDLVAILEGRTKP